MFATWLGSVFTTVFMGSMQRRYDHKGEQIETENGASNEFAPNRLPVFAVKLFEHRGHP